MKLKKGFNINTIDDKSIVTCDDDKFDGLVIINDIGIQIWNMLEREYTIDEIVNVLSKEYDVGLDILNDDVKNFLESIKFAIDGEIK